MANNRSRLYCRELMKRYEWQERINPTALVFIKVPGKNYEELHIVPIKELDEWKEKYGELLTVI